MIDRINGSITQYEDNTEGIDHEYTDKDTEATASTYANYDEENKVDLKGYDDEYDQKMRDEKDGIIFHYIDDNVEYSN